VIWLDYDFGIVFWRGLVRSLRRSLLGQELFSGNRETLRRTFFTRDSILWWIIKTHKLRRRNYRRLLETGRFPDLQWIELRNPAAAEEFLHNVRSSVLGADQGGIEENDRLRSAGHSCRY
jgi:hypothetical protein